MKTIKRRLLGWLMLMMLIIALSKIVLGATWGDLLDVAVAILLVAFVFAWFFLALYLITVSEEDL